MRGVVFDVQTYAIYDGPGIRTLVFFKGCPLRCRWCHNPESWDLHPQMAYLHERCAGCGMCVRACPNKALHLSEGGIIRDMDRCVVCAVCVRACPNDAMERIGREASVEELASEILPDKPFYENSGGGVTFSGGEPTMQTEFLLANLRAMKRDGLHTALETCGAFNEKLCDPLCELVDLFLFDLKMIDAKAHRHWTGVDNRIILDNFKRIHNKIGSKRMAVRMPLIPGVNSDEDSVDALIDFLIDNAYRGRVHLMPYNRMAKNKWQKIGRGEQYVDFGELSEETIQRIQGQLESAGLRSVCEH